MSTIGKLKRDGLIAGDYPLKAKEVTVFGSVETQGTEFQRGDVIALINVQIPVLVDSTLNNGGNRPVGIICDNVKAEPGQAIIATMYIKGEFAKRHLRFGGTDTAHTHERHMTEIGLLIRETVG